jgi:CheY-like chemotaxis protein
VRALISVLTLEHDGPGAIRVRDGLAFLGYHVVQALSVAEAAKRLRVWLPDVVLTDLRVGGEQLLAHIRSHESLAFLPVVVVTASPVPGKGEPLLERGFDGHLRTPFTLSSFERSVEGFAAAGAARRPAPRVRGVREIAERLQA